MNLIEIARAVARRKEEELAKELAAVEADIKFAIVHNQSLANEYWADKVRAYNQVRTAHAIVQILREIENGE